MVTDFITGPEFQVSYSRDIDQVRISHRPSFQVPSDNLISFEDHHQGNQTTIDEIAPLESASSAFASNNHKEESPSSLCIKITHQNERRRFRMPLFNKIHDLVDSSSDAFEEVSDYFTLVSIVSGLLDLDDYEIRFSYRDFEGDCVIIGSQLEFSEAIRDMLDQEKDMLKLEVQIIQEEQYSDETYAEQHASSLRADDNNHLANLLRKRLLDELKETIVPFENYHESTDSFDCKIPIRKTEDACAQTNEDDFFESINLVSTLTENEEESECEQDHEYESLESVECSSSENGDEFIVLE